MRKHETIKASQCWHGESMVPQCQNECQNMAPSRTLDISTHTLILIYYFYCQRKNNRKCSRLSWWKERKRKPLTEYWSMMWDSHSFSLFLKMLRNMATLSSIFKADWRRLNLISLSQQGPLYHPSSHKNELFPSKKAQEFALEELKFSRFNKTN